MNEAFAARCSPTRRRSPRTRSPREQLGRARRWARSTAAQLNVNGGAIALGHPVGATGTRLVLTLLKELRRRGLHRGLATLCVGGGQGAAVFVEACE